MLNQIRKIANDKKFKCVEVDKKIYVDIDVVGGLQSIELRYFPTTNKIFLLINNTYKEAFLEDIKNLTKVML